MLIRFTVLIGFALAAAHPAFGGSLDEAKLGEELRLLVVKEKAKAQLLKQESEMDLGELSSQGAGCNVDIGNVNNKPGVMAPREVTTVVTGPVIQTGNKCN